MAAVITLNGLVAPRSGDAPRPDLRVIPGGRGAARRAPAAVYRRRRLGTALALIVVAGVLYLAATGAATLMGDRLTAGATAEPAQAPAAALVASVPAEGEVYVVRPGDTLWSIARRLQPEGDIRPLVDRLADLNGGAGLRAGQRLRLDGLGG